MQKTIFITGASAGLGKATVKLFQSKGWNVIATMRNPEKETELTKLKNVTVLKLDVTNPIQIQEVAKKAIELHSIDVVLNNAGYGLIGPLEPVASEQLTRQFDTNVLGTIRVIQAFIPHFRKKKSGLFVTTTSVAGLIGFPLYSLYNATKWALEGLTEGLTYELKELGVKIKTVAPGAMRTDFAGRSMDGTSHEAYSELAEKVHKGFDPNTASSAEQIADVIYEAATDDKDIVRYVAGADAKATFERRLQLGNEEFRKEIHQFYFGR